MWPLKNIYFSRKILPQLMIFFASVYTNPLIYFFSQSKKTNRLSVNRLFVRVKCSISSGLIQNIPSPTERHKNSLYVNSTIENIISELQSIREISAFLLFCNINRQYIGYSLLYRLTSLKLRAESDLEIQYQSLVIDNFRNKILEKLLLIDQPVSQGFILAEKRLKDLINSENFNYKNIVDSFGKKSIEISCFWIVLNSAITAWDNKKFFENDLNNSQIYSKMKMINQILYESEFHQSLIPFEIKFLDLNLNRNKIDTTEDKFYIDHLEGLMLIICQLEKMPSSSYSFILQKIKNITRTIYFKNFGKEIENFEYVDIKFTLFQSPLLSKLIEVKQLK
nr:hypothetical protein CcurKRNrm3_p109 [Cryptomonas curvata]